MAVLFSSSCAALALACGGISDPTKGGETVATVSGSLTGTAIPANARVALVWRTAAANGAAYEVGDDVPVVQGKFAISLAVPPATYFSNVEGHGFTGNGASPPPSIGKPTPLPEPAPAPAPNPGGKAPAFGAQIAPRDTVSGGITQPLSAAIAGFVVYVDSNGNGKLDLTGRAASSADQILGGNKELILVYFKDGGALDYEKLRDSSGILPTSGFDLAWTEGRWLPLNVVELKLGQTKLPRPVCQGGPDSVDPGEPNPVAPRPTVPGTGGGSGGGGSGGGGSGGSDGGSSTGGYPNPSDPNLHCAPDGHSFTYVDPTPCAKPTAEPVGLCSLYEGEESTFCGRPGFAQSLPVGEPVPAGWPCPVGGSAGGSTSSDAGFGSDARARDGG